MIGTSRPHSPTWSAGLLKLHVELRAPVISKTYLPDAEKGSVNRISSVSSQPSALATPLHSSLSQAVAAMASALRTVRGRIIVRQLANIAPAVRINVERPR